MAQKFTSADEAVALLGISKDRLNQLREAGKVRGYRDGTSWKFRAEDIEKLVSEGIPTIEAEPSDLALDLDDFEEPQAPAKESAPKPAAPEPSASGLDLNLADDDDAALASPPSDLNLDDIDEPTVAADVEDEPVVADLDEVEEPSDVLSLDDEESISLTDSILLSESALGMTSKRPPSTIIGKAELDLGSDLDLSLKDEGSDLKSAPGSDILSAAPGDDLALEMEPPSPSGEFEGLPEVDIDLEAESSRILAPEEVAKAKGGAAAAKAAAMSDLELAPTDSDPGHGVSDINIGGESAVGSGLTGLSALELEDDEDMVLGEGSDVTLSSESSGINIISPSDSGLALDEVALDLAGSSPIGSSLDLGDVREAAESGLAPMELEAAEGDEFQLTPLGEDVEEEDKDSSQVIALDDVAEEEAVGSPLGGGDSQILSEDFGAVALTPGAVTVVDPSETKFSTANVVMLGCCMILLAGCGMLAYDLVRNMWVWSDVKPANSFLLEAVNPFLK